MYFQEILGTLNAFWQGNGCLLWQPYHTEVGAGTSNPATFLRVLGPEPWWVAYPEPSIRPADGRYGENPNRLQHYYQYQVILKPSPGNVQELFLQSLEALGLDLKKHDFRFVEDNWQSPSLGAWGLGWEAWLDGMEVLQFTYFQECGGLKLNMRACELTYGVERIAMYIQGVESVYDLQWAPSGITYGDIFHAQEVEYCKYNFEAADVDKLFQLFELYLNEGKRLLDTGLIIPAYDHCLRLSHLFNLLDARGALSVTERGRFLLRCRGLAEGCAKGFAEQRETMGHPLSRLSVPGQLNDESPSSAAPTDFNERDTFLLEIGVEELPHGDLEAVCRQAPNLVKSLLDDYQLEHGAIRLYTTPRRIAFIIDNLQSAQQDVEKEVRGPKKKAAKNDAGEWTIPARKFAEAQGSTADDIYFQEQGKEEYCFVRVRQPGRHLSELLSELLARLLKGLQFNKSMGWEDSTVTFSRPVRWLLALHGKTVVPATWQFTDDSGLLSARSLATGSVTYGHRRLGQGPIEIQSAADYLEVLLKHFVVADRDDRLAMLRNEANNRAEELGLAAEDDSELYEEICDLLEWPLPIVGAIPEEAMSLPEEIIITPMKIHQRYIPLRTKNGKLSGQFMAVANGGYDEDAQAIIRAGNERVLNARLRDARYFWDTDTKSTLNDFAANLGNVLFHQKLGSVADKIARLKQLYPILKTAMPIVDDGKLDSLLSLMKADLTTQMVFEFDSLEGTVGMLYARNEGIDEDIALAIFEHRLPRRAGDAMPSKDLGIVAGLLDRVDTLAGYFGIGVKVKGTSDPYGLRRNALAVLALIRASGADLDLEKAFRAALLEYRDLVENTDDALQNVLSFFVDRQTVMARDDGHSHDYVAAATSIHGARPLQVQRCLEALRALQDTQIQNLAEQAKRMQRIAKEPADSIDPALLDDNERALYALYADRGPIVIGHVESGDFDQAMSELVSWAPVISTYFEEVLVNSDDARIRGNRHALIQAVLAAIQQAADFTQIEKR